MRARFHKFGGSARTIFDPDADINLQEALDKANMMKSLDFASIEKQLGRLSTLLVHRAPVLPDRCTTRLDVASQYIGRLLFEMSKGKLRE